MRQILVFSPSAHKVADISVWGKNYIQGIRGGKRIWFVSLKGRPFSDKGEEKKNKTPHQSNKKMLLSIVFSGLRSITRLNGKKKKVSSDFFLWFNLWNKGQKERENKKCNYPRYWPKVKAGIERMSIGVRKAIGLEVWRLGWTNHVWGLCGVLIHIGKYLFEEKLWRFSVFVDIGGYQHRREILLFEYKYFHKSFTEIIYGLL